jgi:hypothetical protein
MNELDFVGTSEAAIPSSKRLPLNARCSRLTLAASICRKHASSLPDALRSLRQPPDECTPRTRTAQR